MKKVGLIGATLGHSYSPVIHGKFADYDYELCEVRPEEIEGLLKSGDYAGFNVTMPYKKTVMQYCDEISDKAQRIGSVNTILCTEDGKLKGYNTDYYGFTYLVKNTEITVEGKKCIVLGSGGASLTVQTALKDMGASEVVVISRSGKDNYENLDRHYDADVIVNTTPVGMYPENGRAPVNINNFKKCTGVLDLIYNPHNTKLVLDAIGKSIHAAGGLEMLVAQAKKACEIFTGMEIRDDEMDDVVDEIKRETLNTVLIGMPGAGKTFVGQQIAKRVGREFVDIDDMIVEHEGMSIPEIFEKKGEAYFRKVESEMLEKACIRSGIVIACGGGIVKKRSNYDIMKQNGAVIWVKRDIDKLETEGRPISKSVPLEQIYEERKDAYESWSDFFINNNEGRE